jgi:hypothetical protein
MATPPSFAVGQVLTSATMNQVGLWKIKTATATSGNTLTVTDAFSADFRNYRINLNFINSIANATVTFRLGSAATNYRYGFIGIPTNAATALVRQGSGTTSTTQGWIGLQTGTAGNRSGGSIDLFDPFTTSQTAWTSTSSNGLGDNTTGPYVGGGWQTDNTSFTDITFTTSAGTIIELTATVYGYR